LYTLNSARISQTAIRVLRGDAVSLIRSALPKDADWLKQSGAVTQVWAAALLLLSTLNNVFLQEKASAEASDADHQVWRIRFENARQRLQEAGIDVTTDLQDSPESYLEQRRRWDHLIFLLGSSMGYQPSEIDPALHRTPATLGECSEPTH
jgi:hypothetical protein